MIRSRRLLSNQVFGMLVFVTTEVMFFVALISSFLVIRGDASRFIIPDGLKLPVAMTAYNTIALLLSGICLFLASYKTKDYLSSESKPYYWWAVVLGLFFVLVQGYEWFQLLSFGLSMRSNIFGALFFLLIGSHAFHAICGILFLSLLFLAKRGQIFKEDLKAAQIFWFFVVGIWPVLYGLVYF